MKCLQFTPLNVKTKWENHLKIPDDMNHIYKLNYKSLRLAQVAKIGVEVTTFQVQFHVKLKGKGFTYMSKQRKHVQEFGYICQACLRIAG